MVGKRLPTATGRHLGKANAFNTLTPENSAESERLIGERPTRTKQSCTANDFE